MFKTLFLSVFVWNTQSKIYLRIRVLIIQFIIIINTELNGQISHSSESFTQVRVYLSHVLPWVWNCLCSNWDDNMILLFIFLLCGDRTKENGCPSDSSVVLVVERRYSSSWWNSKLYSNGKISAHSIHAGVHFSMVRCQAPVWDKYWKKMLQFIACYRT
jgi:hypothetical protein